MKLTPPASSSDIERARAIAARLTQTSAGERPAAPERPEDYLHFAGRIAAGASGPAERAAVARSFAPDVPAEPPAGPPFTPAPLAAPPPEPPAPEFQLEPGFEPPLPVVAAPVPPAPRPEPAPAALPHPADLPAPPVLRKPAPPLSTAPKVAPSPPPLPVAPPLPQAPAGEPVFTIEEAPETPVEEETMGVLEEASEEEDSPFAAAEIEFDEELTSAAVAAAEPEAPPAPEPSRPWGEILDDAIYLAHARCALVMDAAGNIGEFRGDWPKNTLDKVGARLLRGIEQAPSPPTPEASQLVEIQLGSFWLTGLKVLVSGKPVVVGFLSQAPIKREVRPGIEVEVRRGHPL
jgi:hypothetical protein